MHTAHASKHDEAIVNSDTYFDDHIKIIHNHYVPPFDLITCEILDSMLQHASTEQIAQFSQLHPDTVRRTLHMIESTLDTSSHSQIIDNCQLRMWSSVMQRQINDETHTFE